MNLFKQKQSVTSSISHVLINKQKGKFPEPIVTIRQLEEKDINEVRQLLYDHFNSLTLPAVIYWSIQHIYDLLVIIVINYIFFLDLKKIFYFLIIFVIYLYIRAKLEFLNHIRKDCPDLENLYKSYINVEGCNFWVAEVYDNNFGSGSRTTCSDIHEREKIMFEQEEEQGKLINNEKGNLNEKNLEENIIKKDILEKNSTYENNEISKDLNTPFNDNLNEDFKNKCNTNNNEIEQQKNINNSENYNTGENINNNNNNDTTNKIDILKSNASNLLNKEDNNNNINFKANNSQNENYILNDDKNNNINICKIDNVKDDLSDNLIKDINKNTETEINKKYNNNFNNCDNSNIKEDNNNNNNVLNRQYNLNNKTLNSKNSTCKHDEDTAQNIYDNSENVSNNKCKLKEDLKRNTIMNSIDTEERKDTKTNDNNDYINAKNCPDNSANENNSNNEDNLHKTKDDNEKNNVKIFNIDNLNKGKNKMLCDIRDFSRKQLIANKRNVQSGLNEIKKKILSSKMNEDEDFNFRYLNRKIVGCVGIVPFKGDNSIAQLVRMVVKKDNRRMRIGSRLLIQLENFAHEQNYQELKVFTNNLNTDSLYFVKQNGFNLSQIVRRGLMRGDLLIWSKILNKDDFYKFNSADVQSYTNNILD
ncbi:N-acetyltransferase, putative [Plasmodium relictum]|uniref:N-acetyltransferase, putative n=1 Tax=Plasmodium relictum TaxID=85471 RepID=A0A1J1HE13_PLARL|nr:N-acetyltransferase, putative [Plasmodium relictum]CRH03781.1 N-acetyltransferase, putative [Plasmodium relictum]